MERTFSINSSTNSHPQWQRTVAHQLCKQARNLYYSARSASPHHARTAQPHTLTSKASVCAQMVSRTPMRKASLARLLEEKHVDWWWI